MPTHHKGTPQEVQALDTFIKLTRATDSLQARLAQREAFGDLTPRQFGVLEALHHLGPMRQGEICAKLLTSGGNITLVVDNLEKGGLVRRERSAEDRRVVVVSLTEAGREKISQVFPKHLADIVDEMSILTSEEQEELGRLCRILGKQERAYDWGYMDEQVGTTGR
jgi:MarR family 2-MHQ and catechol resistance regulon transcriptional repressor